MASKLKNYLDQHEKLEFPHSLKGEKIEDWLAELAEIDGYYVGIAQSLIKKAPVPEPIEYQPMRNIRLDLQILYESADIDQETYNKGNKYVSSLENLVKTIRKES